MDDEMARGPETIAELRRSLGAQLATFRLAAALTQGQLAKAAICDRTTLVHDYKRPDDPDTLPPADAIAVVPATFNTINKWAAGISDNFALGLLNEAIGLKLPLIVAPYAKATLASHPAFDGSLQTLSGWGVRVLPSEIIRPN